MAKRALITGITGQDGSYLAEFLLANDYEVHGILRRTSSFNTGRIDHIFDQLHLHRGDLLDVGSLQAALAEAKPDEVYNLAAQSHVGDSFHVPDYTYRVNYLGACNLFDAVRKVCPKARVYQASSSEMFGNEPANQSEATRLNPVSPYAVAKTAAHQAARFHRHAYGLHVSCGILFNHESERRGETFVTRKVCRAAARIKMGLQDRLVLGNLDARRDWGYAPDYVQAMWKMLQRDEADDFVIGTGNSYSVRDLLAEAFRHVGLAWETCVVTSDQYKRPAEVHHLQADAAKAREVLGWRPAVTFNEMVKRMVDAEMGVAGE